MSTFRSFTTVYADYEPDWVRWRRCPEWYGPRPTFRRSIPASSCAWPRSRAVARAWCCACTSTTTPAGYINLDQAGHAYELWYASDDQWERDHDVDPHFSGRYRLHRSLEHAVARLGIWEMECGRLGRSYPPEQWPADPDDMAIGAYMDGDRFAWITAHSVPLAGDLDLDVDDGD